MSEVSTLVDISLPEGHLEGTAATLSAWLVKPGDKVKAGDPVAELETDKVAMEVTAPENGVIAELIAKVGDSVATEQVIARMGDAAEEAALSKAEQTATADQVSRLAAKAEKESSAADVADADKKGRELLSPAVRRLLREHDLDLAPIKGSGKDGRVTRNDVLRYIESGGVAAQSAASTATEPNAPEPQAPAVSSQAVSARSVTASQPMQQMARERRPLVGEKIPHSNMRRSIAAHMVDSLLKTSPHVTSVFEMDMGNIIEHRKWHKKEFAEHGVNLTFTAYFLMAMAQAVKKVPQVNARFHEDCLEIFSDVNIGVGTALGDQGLVVPVIDQVQDMNLFEVAAALSEKTEKAREGKLTPADMSNGTITISNHGVSGSLFAAPIIINQPQVAIVGIGKLEKRVVIEEVNGVDTMVIRPRCYVSLSIDHRALDAHQTNSFLAEFVRVIESWGE